MEILLIAIAIITVLIGLCIWLWKSKLKDREKPPEGYQTALEGVVAHKRPWYVTLMAYAPLVALGGPSGWSVGVIASHVYPNFIAIGAGLMFEMVYLGAVFLTDARAKTYLPTVAIAVSCAVIYNVLHAADYYHVIAYDEGWVRWVISLIHGIPIPVLAFSYALLLHSYTNQKAVQAPVPAVVNQPELIPAWVNQLIDSLTVKLGEMSLALENQAEKIANMESQPTSQPGDFEVQLVQIEKRLISSLKPAIQEVIPAIQPANPARLLANPDQLDRAVQLAVALGKDYKQSQKKLGITDAQTLEVRLKEGFQDIFLSE